HSPRSFVGDPGFTLNLFGGNSATGGSHQIDRIEPKPERSRGVVVNRVCCRVNVVPAEIATIGRALGNTMILCHSVTVFAKDAIGIEMGLEPFQAGGIVWKHAI